MGKEGDLWDDSALINAFDQAISHYKIMHTKGGHDGSSKGGRVISSMEENSSAIADESYAAKSETDINSNVASNHTTEMGETIDPLSVTENCPVDTCAPEQHISSSNGQNVQDVSQSYTDTQGAEDYNHLMNRYYELEEQRQKILQQLYQWGTPYTSQEHQTPADQASCQTVACSCCSYVCPCLLAPCTSLPACSSGKSSGHKENPFSLESGDVVNTAMGAAERALCSLKTNVSCITDVNKGKEGEADANVCGTAQHNSSETDLSVVLNAWYTAGLYTGKYLTEQSFAKKRQG